MRANIVAHGDGCDCEYCGHHGSQAPYVCVDNGDDFADFRLPEEDELVILTDQHGNRFELRRLPC